MKAHSPCPEANELRELLDGSLTDERQDVCMSHMEFCPCCQEKLEELATSGSDLCRLVGQLHASEPAANSAYWPAFRALDGALTETVVPKTPVRRRDLSLDFLEPPTDSAYLGRIAQFDVMRVLGRGGMGIVLEAFDSRLQRHVALKFLDPELANDQTARQRFCREARSAAAIAHENVVAVHQVETSGDDKLPYLVMQLIAGESLDQRLARERLLPVREIVRISMETAHGLAAAHAQDLMHRDIKPANILLESTQQRVKLSDFGLAHAVQDVKLTATGFVSGTPQYMAPEQALGEPADARADLFSLGVVMYEMCTGQPPFSGNSALAILKQIAETKPRPIRELNPAIPQWLADTVDKLLAKKPANRIQSARDLAELFDFEWALLKTTSNDVPNVCQIEQRKRNLRNRGLMFGVGATFLALGLFGGRYLQQRAVVPPATAADAAVTASTPQSLLSTNAGVVWSVSFNPTGDTVVMAVEDGTVRLWDWAKNSVKSTFPAHHSAAWSAKISADGQLLATSGDDGLVKVWSQADSKLLKTFEHASVRSSTFSHDGKRLYSGGRDGTLRAWSLDQEAPVAEARQSGTVYALAVSPDDETVATAGTKEIELWNASTLTRKLPLEGHAGPIYGLAYHPDGHRIASVGWDKKIRIWDTGTGSLIKSWAGHEGDGWSVAFSPDGSRLVTGGTEGDLKIWQAETGELLETFTGQNSATHTVAFHPDGRYVVSGGRDGAAKIWNIGQLDAH